MLSEDENAVTNKQLLDEIVKSRSELKNSIEASEARLVLKIELANNKIKKLEEENNTLKEKIEQLERENRKKNIIIFGVKRSPDITISKFICDELNTLLDLNITEADISDVFPLGKGDSCPIKVEFCSYVKKLLVLKNANKLKDTRISIAKDLSTKQREDYKILKKHLTLAKLDEANNKCFIRNDKLIVNGTSYTIEDLESIERGPTSEAKSVSAPSTPTREVLSKADPTQTNQQLNDTKKNYLETTTSSGGTSRKKEQKEPLTSTSIMLRSRIGR